MKNRSIFLLVIIATLAAGTGFLPGPGGSALWAGSMDAMLPQPVAPEHFDLLKKHSPFTRTFNLSDTLVLSGVANLEGEQVATLIDAVDGQTLAVSALPNRLGWKLVECKRPDDLEAAVVSIAVENGEIIRVYYDEERVKNASQLASRGAREQNQKFVGRMIAHSLPASINEIQDPVEKGRAIGKYIESGGFDRAPMDAVKLALSQSDPQARGTVMSAAFGRLGGGVGGVKYDATVERLNSLENARDRDFAINGLAHGLAGKDPQGALKWANSISNEGFRKVVVENVTRRIQMR